LSARTSPSVRAASETGGFSFDHQAASFAERAGLPPQEAAAVAAAVGGIVAGAADGGGVLLEVGAGSGEIGAGLAAAPDLPYLGLDLSLPMLVRFRARLRPAVAGRLVRADAGAGWPLPAGRVGAVFLSRAAHLLDGDHLAAEVRRTAHPGGAWLLLGRVRREPESVRATLRREMRRLLAAAGVAGRSGEQAHDRLLAALTAVGARPLPPRVVASWQVAERPAAALAAWRGKGGLAGVALPAAVQEEVLGRLEAWARRRWDDLDAPHEATERYELSGVRLPPRDPVEGEEAA
jgi:SAM-dependent methyltransferase